MIAEILRILLALTILAMTALAFAYLRQRRLSPLDFCGWALLALIVPLLGPFLVIASRPGRPSGIPTRKVPSSR